MNEDFEKLKKIVAANGSQGAAVLKAVIDYLEQGSETPTYPGESGQVMLSDGEGGLTVSEFLTTTSSGNLQVGNSERSKGIYLFDAVSGNRYLVQMANGQLTTTQL